jgi:hypothetical protein
MGREFSQNATNYSVVVIQHWRFMEPISGLVFEIIRGLGQARIFAALHHK